MIKSIIVVTASVVAGVYMNANGVLSVEMVEIAAGSIQHGLGIMVDEATPMVVSAYDSAVAYASGLL